MTSSRNLPANGKDEASFTTPSTGRVEVTLDWTIGSSLVSMVLAQAPCSFEQLQSSSCDLLFSRISPPKPLTDSTTLLRAGTYTLFVSNPNPVPERVSAQVVLTSAGCPAE